MSKSKTASELIFKICSYEHLGATVNYTNTAPLDFSDFDANTYSSALENMADSMLSKAIHKRASHRKFKENQFAATTLLQILFNSYSLKNSTGSYTIPQAGGLESMSLLVLSSTSKDLILQSYNSRTYKLNHIKSIEIELASLFYTKSIDFSSVTHCILILGDLQLLSEQYLARGFKFACFQAGHIAQNILLNAAILNIKAIPLGSLIEENITTHCLSTNHYPLYAVVM